METEIAKLLLKIKAVFLSPNVPFTWASGIKSPIYCDNRLILSYPDVRTQVEKGLAALITKNYPATEAVFGTATAGIAHAAIVADILKMPMGYVRNSSKDHGRNNQIEGRIVPKTKVVIIEDLISTAGSVCEIVSVLRDADVEVLGIVSIFTYGMQKGYDKLLETNITNISLTNFNCLIKVAAKEGYISTKDIDKCIAFQKQPDSLEWMSM
ncbi:MAG: orotate phosphoribosyltransferase [Candidatus Izemoplasmatales bacterium]|nr:orotate phosphoribosyltransferase [Candidatus Izemoplasmatales bacterium]MDD3865098.1 orotate phosphoribosyltransferase [Candidatus Izemoplasmatales bacterium]